MKTEMVTVGRIAGLNYMPDKARPSKTTFIIWNQWRSGAKSIFSKYLAEYLLQDTRVGRVVFLDRIASGGMSDNRLTGQERRAMRTEADMQFADEYADSVRVITKVEPIILCGSSGGGLSVLATIEGMSKWIKNENVKAVLVEPTGLGNYGIAGVPVSALIHGMSKHIWAYRHRLQRGWWTPMDREQYSAKGHPTEYRANYFMKNHTSQHLERLTSASQVAVAVYLSADSHMHREKDRAKLLKLIKLPHQVHVINGNHDKLCQPPNLSKLYLKSLT